MKRAATPIRCNFVMILFKLSISVHCKCKVMLLHSCTPNMHFYNLAWILVGDSVILMTPNWSSRSHGCAFPSHLDELGLKSPSPLSLTYKG